MEGSERVQLPVYFEDAELEHIALLIADMLERLMLHNDRIPLSPESLTRFHSRSPPTISVLEYLRRIIRFTNVERSCLLATLHYIDQICSRAPLFTLSSLTCHRFIIASICVSSKGLCDVFCTNQLYAKVGGIPVSELNVLEREFLKAIEWRLTCTREILQEYYVNLVRTHSAGTFVIIGPQERHYSSRSPSSSSNSEGTPSSDSEMDLDVGADSSSSGDRSGSPRPSSPLATLNEVPRGVRTRRRGMSRASTSTASTILVDPPAVPPETGRRATVEQSMAFAALQESLRRGEGETPGEGRGRT